MDSGTRVPEALISSFATSSEAATTAMAGEVSVGREIHGSNPTKVSTQLSKQLESRQVKTSLFWTCLDLLPDGMISLVLLDTSNSRHEHLGQCAGQLVINLNDMVPPHVGEILVSTVSSFSLSFFVCKDPEI